MLGPTAHTGHSINNKDLRGLQVQRTPGHSPKGNLGVQKRPLRPTAHTAAALVHRNHTFVHHNLSAILNFIYSVLDHVCSQPTGVVSHVKRTLV